MTILVTGAKSGLGKAIAEELTVELSLPVVKLDKEECNLAHPIDILRWVNAYRDNVNHPFDGVPFDGVVNCAGINHQDFLENQQIHDLIRIMAVNALAPSVLVGELVKTSLLTSGSWVCNIISNASHMPMTGSNAYNMSKGALHISTLQMARELTPKHGISVFGISPNKLKGTGMSRQIETEVKRVRGWSAEFARDYQLKALLNKEETPPHVVARFIANIVKDPEITKFASGCIYPIGA